MPRPPWEYLFQSFSQHNFPDLYMPTLVAAILLLGVLLIVYNVRTRQLHRHRPYLEMYEWLLWTGIVLFLLLVVYWIFTFDWIIVLATEVVGLGAFIWIRFFRFPPYFRAYERQLAKQRYFSRQRFSHPESTIRSKQKSARRRRRR